MSSHSNWHPFNATEVAKLKDDIKIVYWIRAASPNGAATDTLYIGSTRRPKYRLNGLLKGLAISDPVLAAQQHSAAPTLQPHASNGLEFSWQDTTGDPAIVEKGYLLTYCADAGRLPVCNLKM